GRFIGNSSTASGQGGGAVHNQNSSGNQFLDCEFIGNSAHATGGNGGAMYNYSHSPIIRGCRFVANTAASGGAMRNTTNSNPQIVNCDFVGNRASGTSIAGAVYNNTNSHGSLINCRFIGNSGPA